MRAMSAYSPASRLIAFNKPYGVICQFSPHPSHASLADYIAEPNYYPAGRLDTDSEGLVLLTQDGALQHALSDPRFGCAKTYWVQVEGIPSSEALHALTTGVALTERKNGQTMVWKTQPACVHVLTALEVSALWQRIPPIRVRKHIPTSWLALTITEGKNRQVRRMTAAVGLPTLRLIRVAIGDLTVWDTPLGTWQWRDAPRIKSRSKAWR